MTSKRGRFFGFISQLSMNKKTLIHSLLIFSEIDEETLMTEGGYTRFNLFFDILGYWCIVFAHQDSLPP